MMLSAQTLDANAAQQELSFFFASGHYLSLDLSTHSTCPKYIDVPHCIPHPQTAIFDGQGVISHDPITSNQAGRGLHVSLLSHLFRISHWQF